MSSEVFKLASLLHKEDDNPKSLSQTITELVHNKKKENELLSMLSVSRSHLNNVFMPSRINNEALSSLMKNIKCQNIRPNILPSNVLALLQKTRG